MHQSLLERRRECGKLAAKVAGIVATAKEDRRELTADERNTVSELSLRFDTLGEGIRSETGEPFPTFTENGLRGVIEHGAEIVDASAPFEGTADNGERSAPAIGGMEERTLTYQVRQALLARKASGAVNYGEDERKRKIFRDFLQYGESAIPAAEFRALQADSDTGGGYLTAPQQLAGEVLTGLDNELFLSRLTRPFLLGDGVSSLGVPSLETDVSDADWTSEIATGSEDTAMSFGKRELTPHPLAKRIKVSRKLLRSTALDAERFVRSRLEFKFSAALEAGFLTGNGAQQPLGVFTASNDGIPTSRDVSTGNTTTAIGADGLIEAQQSLKAQYARNASWIFSRQAITGIRKLKDGDGNYLWQPGLGSFQPPSILGTRYFQSEYCPNTFTTGLYVGVIGDFRFYWVAYALRLEIQRLVELYAEANQIGLIGRLEADGMPVLSEAFARVTLA